MKYARSEYAYLKGRTLGPGVILLVPDKTEEYAAIIDLPNRRPPHTLRPHDIRGIAIEANGPADQVWVISALTRWIRIQQMKIEALPKIWQDAIRDAK